MLVTDMKQHFGTLQSFTEKVASSDLAGRSSRADTRGSPLAPRVDYVAAPRNSNSSNISALRQQEHTADERMSCGLVGRTLSMQDVMNRAAATAAGSSALMTTNKAEKEASRMLSMPLRLIRASAMRPAPDSPDRTAIALDDEMCMLLWKVSGFWLPLARWGNRGGAKAFLNPFFVYDCRPPTNSH